MSQEDLKSLMNELDEKAQRIEEVTILFLDISSTCTGFSCVMVNFATKKARIVNAGAIWFDDKMNQQDKCGYFYDMIVNYFNIIHKVDYIVAEAYMINPKKLMGSLVSPEIHGALKAAGSEIGTKVVTFPVQSWRSELGVKKKNDDYKKPTKDKVLEFVKIPDKVTSNITKGQRNTPSDLFDALGLAIGFLKRIGIKHYNFSGLEIQPHVGVLEEYIKK